MKFVSGAGNLFPWLDFEILVVMVACPLLNPEGLWISEFLALILPLINIALNKMAEIVIVFQALYNGA
jgi:cell shape-determining protein MreD